MLSKDLQSKLNKISKIEGYLVPGQEMILYKLASFLEPGSVVVEIGSYKGKSTACMAIGMKKGTKLYAIDTFKGNKKDFLPGTQFDGNDFYDTFLENMKVMGVSDKIKAVRSTSFKAGKRWKLPIDLLFIDGSHVYEDVKKDFESFFPWVKPGGIVAFHDVDREFPGVYRVWNQLVKRKLSSYRAETTLSFGFKKHKGNSKKKDSSRLKEIVFGTDHKVFVLIPVFNRLEHTKRCLHSLSRQKYKNLDVIVVDDGSTDGTYKYVSKKYPQWKVIKGDGNWWWTKSMYKGVEKALESAGEDDFILSMNNDCFFENNYVGNIVKASNKNGRAIAGSLILDAHDHSIVVDAGVKIHWPSNLIYAVAGNVSSSVKFFTDRKIIKDIDTLPGKGTLIPIEVFSKIGNFNYKLLPHYLADYEFFCRAKEKGLQLVVSSDAVVYNFSKETGQYMKDTSKPMSLRESLYLLFGRRSKNNVIDYFWFLMLRCPKHYLIGNMLDLALRVLSYFPLLTSIVSGLKLLRHNLPIYVYQSWLRFKRSLSNT